MGYRVEGYAAYLFFAGGKERERIHAIGDCAPQKGDPVEDHGGFILVAEEELTEDVENDHREEAYSRIGTDEKERHCRGL